MDFESISSYPKWVTHGELPLPEFVTSFFYIAHLQMARLHEEHKKGIVSTQKILFFFVILVLK